jgi:hypothetical protein
LTVKVYTPAGKLANALFDTNEVPLIENEYGAEPPLAKTAKLPGKQVGTELVMESMTKGPGCVILTKLEIVHPFASLACMVYAPADNALNMPFVVVVALGNNV